MDKKYYYHIYNNLFEYLVYRNKKLPKKLTQLEFNESFDADNLIVIYADDIAIILTKHGSKYAVLGADGKRKIKDISTKNKLSEILYICDINYVADKTATSLTSTNKMLQDLKQTYPDIWFQIRPYKTFELNIPQSVAVPKHTIASKEDVDKLLNVEHKTKNSIPQIYEWDPPICWLGGRSGQFVEVERYSGIIGIQKVIRHIID